MVTCGLQVLSRVQYSLERFMKRCLDHNLALKRIGEKGLLLGNTRFTDFIFIFRAIELILPLNFSLPQCLIESHSHYCKKKQVLICKLMVTW